MLPVRAALVLPLLLALAACEVTPEGEIVPQRGFLSGFAAPDVSGGPSARAEPGGGADLVEAAAIAGGDVVVAGPPGYCIDTSTVESSPRGGFAVLASCNILSAGQSGAAVTPALVTVSAGPREAQPVQPGAETLARLSDASALAADESDTLTMVYLAEGGDALLPGGASQYWRGAFLVGARLIGIAVYAPPNSGLTRAEGRRLLELTAERIRRASPDAPIPVSGNGAGTSRG
jgi:hypothetical protein